MKISLYGHIEHGRIIVNEPMKTTKHLSKDSRSLGRVLNRVLSKSSSSSSSASAQSLQGHLPPHTGGFTVPTQENTTQKHKHSCLEGDSKPKSQ
jgi:hypothetical protein